MKVPLTLSSFLRDPWLVLVCSMWMESVAGVGYLFGSISPSIKSSAGFNQREIAAMGFAKELGGCIGFLAGVLCERFPIWAALVVGSLQNLIGYGWIWLIVSGRATPAPLSAMCILIFVGNNGQTYFSTAALFSCVQNFPKSRGPVVGILKGFSGLSGAILTQIYTSMHSPDNATLIFMAAVGPSMVVAALMFIIRPVSGHEQTGKQPSDRSSFVFIHSVCLLLAAYLMGALLLEDLVELGHNVIILLTVVLLILLIAPITIPLISAIGSPRPTSANQENLLLESHENEQIEVILSEVENEKSKNDDMLPELERAKRVQKLHVKLFQAAAAGAVGVEKRRGPHRGEDFTLCQALVKADFWLLLLSLVLGAGSGLMVFDNLGQMSESLGYNETHIFISMISIWNFLGRIGGGYLSEIIVRDYAYPRPIALAFGQGVMAVGLLFIGMGWSGALYIGTLLVGLGYGVHWAIVPAAASELFGLKNFGSLYNFLVCATPAGSLICSQLIASNIYEYEAERQAHKNHLSAVLVGGLLTEEALKCEGAVCFFLSCMIMSGLCIVAVILSSVLVHRTKIVYTNLYESYFLT